MIGRERHPVYRARQAQSNGKAGTGTSLEVSVGASPRFPKAPKLPGEALLSFKSLWSLDLTHNGLFQGQWSTIAAHLPRMARVA